MSVPPTEARKSRSGFRLDRVMAATLLTLQGWPPRRAVHKAKAWWVLKLSPRHYAVALVSQTCHPANTPLAGLNI